jgi:hypothetical protein
MPGAEARPGDDARKDLIEFPAPCRRRGFQDGVSTPRRIEMNMQQQLSAAQPATQPQNRLKAERIQEPLVAAQVARRLRQLPGWALAPAGKTIVRRFQMGSTGVASAYAAFLGAMAEADDQPISIAIQGGLVLVHLTGLTPPGSACGVTEATLDFAMRLVTV